MAPMTPPGRTHDGRRAAGWHVSVRLMTLLLVTWLPAAWASSGLPVTLPPLEGDARLEAALLERTNAARTSRGLPALARHEGLALAARHHAEQMADGNFLSHASPDPAREHVGDRLALAGVPLVEHGENLARVADRDDAARESVDGWLASASHRSNLLSSTFTHVGFGTAEATSGAVYVVQVLAARPLERVATRVSLHEDAVTHWSIAVEADGPQRIALFVDGEARPPRDLPDGRSEIELSLGPQPTRLEIGTALGDGRFALEDAAWLEPSTGSARPDRTAPAERVRIEEAAVRQEPRRRIEVTLRYADPPPELLLFVDGAYAAGSQIEPGHLRALVPAAGPPVTLEVGLRDGRGRGRILERFVLERAEPPRLVADAAP